jgi:xylulokinase
MKSFTGEIGEIRATGGGASSDVWLQIKADILGTPITALSGGEIGAAGTAALTGVAIGAYSSLKKTVAASGGVRKVFYPNESNKAAYAELYKKYANLYNAVKNL